MWIKIKKAIPDILISTDIIVGFPGETEEDFQENAGRGRQGRILNGIHIPVLKENGTPAAVMDDQIDEEVAKERFNRLLEHVNAGVEKISESLVELSRKSLWKKSTDRIPKC